MKASPYWFVTVPLTYSSVCSRAMFMYPSRQESTPGIEQRIDARKQNENASSVGRTSVIDARCQSDNDRLAHDAFQEIGR